MNDAEPMEGGVPLYWCQRSPLMLLYLQHYRGYFIIKCKTTSTLARHRQSQQPSHRLCHSLLDPSTHTTRHFAPWLKWAKAHHCVPQNFKWHTLKTMILYSRILYCSTITVPSNWHLSTITSSVLAFEKEISKNVSIVWKKINLLIKILCTSRSCFFSYILVYYFNY